MSVWRLRLLVDEHAVSAQAVLMKFPPPTSFIFSPAVATPSVELGSTPLMQA